MIYKQLVWHICRLFRRRSQVLAEVKSKERALFWVGYIFMENLHSIMLEDVKESIVYLEIARSVI